MHLHHSRVIERILRAPFFLCTILLLLGSCALIDYHSSFACGNINSNGEPNGSWVIYNSRNDNQAPYTIKATGNLVNGRLDGIWTKWGSTIEHGKFKVFEGRFKNGIPNGEFTIETSGDAAVQMYQFGKPFYSTFQDVNGNISGTIQGELYGDEFNVKVYVTYVVENNQIVSVLAGEKRYAEKDFEGLKKYIDWYIRDLNNGVKSAKPKDTPAGLEGC